MTWCSKLAGEVVGGHAPVTVEATGELRGSGLLTERFSIYTQTVLVSGCHPPLARLHWDSVSGDHIECGVSVAIEGRACGVRNHALGPLRHQYHWNYLATCSCSDGTRVLTAQLIVGTVRTDKRTGPQSQKGNPAFRGEVLDRWPASPSVLKR